MACRVPWTPEAFASVPILSISPGLMRKNDAEGRGLGVGIGKEQKVIRFSASSTCELAIPACCPSRARP
eukprot:3206578-Alexandrium_andersonii.AAC.1